MACEFFSGWETGDASEWGSTTGTTAVQTATLVTGGYTGKVTATGGATAFFQSSAFTIATTAYARCRLRVHVTTNPTTNQTNRQVFGFLSPTSSQLGYVALSITTTGVLTLAVFGNSASTTTPITADQTYLVELKVTLAGAASSVEYQLDGVTKATLINQSYGATEIGFVRCNVSSSSGVIDIYFDDVSVDDTAYPGEGWCITRQGTTGTPTYDAWTKTGAATAALCWSNTPYATATNCNMAGTAASAQTMVVAPFSATQTGHGTETVAATDVVNACRQVLIAKVSGASGAPTLALRTRIGGVDTDGTANTLTTSDVAFRGDVFTASAADLESAEIGAVRSTSSNNRTATVEDTWLLIDYAAGEEPPVGEGPAVGSLALLGCGR